MANSKLRSVKGLLFPLLALAGACLLAGACGTKDEDEDGTGGSTSTGGSSGGGEAGAGGAGAEAGTGGPGGAPSGGAGGRECLDNPRPACGEDALIDDGEGEMYICPNDGKIGYWYIETDETGGSIGPSPFAMSDLGGGDHVARIWGNGFNEYVSLAVMVLGCNTADPYDASAYSGIQIQAAGTTGIISGDPPVHWLRLVVWTTDTASVDSGGICVPAGAQQCDGHFFADVFLEDGWNTKNVIWADLGQPDWAVQTTFDPAHILRMEFKIDFSSNPGADFDLNVANLTFY